ncbi:MAG: hypothetical protein C0404_02555 [Verrucomicrobia bacterium]|nr:hypothetical protein [Verrucomicrobiota bacterium]
MSVMKQQRMEEARKVARLFDVQRAKHDIVSIWEKARWMDTKAVYGGVWAAARCLREAGIKDVRIVDLPWDGRKSVGGWIMPPAWFVSRARLEAINGGGRKTVLADFSRNPQNIVYMSPGTPGGGWVRGGVVVCKDPTHFKGKLKGKFVFLTEGIGSFATCDFLGKEEARGFILSVPNAKRDAARYVNYTVPLDSTRACVPGFSLTPAAGEKLRQLLAADPGLVLRAQVKALRRKGTWPLLTGSIGEGDPAVYVCGHIDEIGAQDNASGVGTAIEAMRVLNAIRDSKKFAPQLKKVVFFFSVEIRGIQCWLNQQRSAPNFLGGINLDMVGADPRREPAKMSVLLGYRNRPHFSADVLLESVKLANREVGGMITDMRPNFVSDGMFGIDHLTGHVSLEQKTGKTYHSSADTPVVLSNKALKWSGAAVLAYLYRMTRLDNQEILRIASGVFQAARQVAAKREDDRDVQLRKAVIRLKTLKRALKMPAIYRDWRSAEAGYAAGIRRTNGLWPEMEQSIQIDEWISAIGSRIRGAQPVLAQDSRNAVRTAAGLVPQALFRGFLSFEDHVTEQQAAELYRRTGLSAGWGTAPWAWMFATYCRGKQTVLEIVNEMRGVGVDVDLGSAIKLTEYLEDRELMRLRPVITAAVLKAKLRRIGVRRNSVLMVHSSLSRFGYMQGGPPMVIDAILKTIGPGGTLVMPTHSNCVLGTPPYNPATSPSNTGALTEYFRKMPGVVRSPHPTHSVAALGPAAAELVEAHRPDRAPMARDGFWGKLYDRDGHVLLMCPIRSSTIFHAGETWLGLLQPPLLAHAMDGDGNRQVNVLPNGPWHVDHFEPTMARPLMSRGIMKSAKLGESSIYFAPARAMAEISVEVNRRDPLVSLGRAGKCKCFYCAALRKNAGRRKPR